MGRGRQKAKHTKVARDLKYYSPDTNYGALANELHHTTEPYGSAEAPRAEVRAPSPVSPELDKWAEYLDDSEDADESDFMDDADADESRTA
jgi:hypothetical protein